MGVGTISAREAYHMMTLYKSTILPILEYCNQFWSPVKIGDLRKIEAVQRNFTSKINEIRDKSHWDRLKHLQMYSLKRRGAPSRKVHHNIYPSDYI